MVMSGEIILTAVLAGAATAGLRVLPFLLGDRLASAELRNLFADLFPPAVLAVLIAFMAVGAGASDGMVLLSQAAGAAVTVAAHLAWRKLLLSVGSGTAVCMLIQNFWM